MYFVVLLNCFLVLILFNCFSYVQQKAREEREAKRSMIDPRHEHIINTVAESLALSTEEVTESLLEGNQVQLMVEVQSLILLFGLPLVPEVFFRCEERRERNGERKPLVAGDVNLAIML